MTLCFFFTFSFLHQNTARDGENYLLYSLLFPNYVKWACHPRHKYFIHICSISRCGLHGCVWSGCNTVGVIGPPLSPALMKRCCGAPLGSFSSPGVWTEVSMLPGPGDLTSPLRSRCVDAYEPHRETTQRKREHVKCSVYLLCTLSGEGGGMSGAPDAINRPWCCNREYMNWAIKDVEYCGRNITRNINIVWKQNRWMEG